MTSLDNTFFFHLTHTPLWKNFCLGINDIRRERKGSDRLNITMKSPEILGTSYRPRLTVSDNDNLCYYTVLRCRASHQYPPPRHTFSAPLLEKSSTSFHVFLYTLILFCVDYLYVLAYCCTHSRTAKFRPLALQPL